MLYEYILIVVLASPQVIDASGVMWEYDIVRKHWIVMPRREVGAYHHPYFLHNSVIRDYQGYSIIEKRLYHLADNSKLRTTA